jgi:hypothetical protein
MRGPGSVAHSAPEDGIARASTFGVIAGSRTAARARSKRSDASSNATRERIRQIEAKALRKLRHPSRSRKLKDYLE